MNEFLHGWWFGYWIGAGIVLVFWSLYDWSRQRQLKKYREALTAIVAFSPGNFRPLADEVKIWHLARDALA